MDDRLRKFAQVVDSGSYTKAALSMHISQPALSTAIQKLEHELRTPLFTKKGKTLELTEAGKFAYATAKELTAQTQNLIRKISDLEQHEVAAAIGMIDSVANAFMASGSSFDVLNTISRLSIVVNNSRFLIRAIERDELDMAFITRQRSGRMPSLVETVPFASESMPLVCHPADLLPVMQALRSGSVPHFINYDQASTTSQIIIDGLKDLGLQPNIEYYSSSPEVILRLVLLRKGVAVLPTISVKDYVLNGTICALSSPVPITVQRDISVAYRKDKPLSQTLDNIVMHAKMLFE